MQLFTTVALSATAIIIGLILIALYNRRAHRSHRIPLTGNLIAVGVMTSLLVLAVSCWGDLLLYGCLPGINTVLMQP